MKQIVAIVKPFRAQAVIEAVSELPVETVLVSEAKGFGRQKDRLGQYVGSEYSPVYLPKIEITILVEDQLVEQVTQRIVDIALTGRMGDGKIFVFPTLGGSEF